jgi:hypothetical protein
MARIPVIASKSDVPAGHGHVWDQIASSRGVDGLVELTATVGYYGMLACTLNAFEVTPEAGTEVLNVS